MKKIYAIIVGIFISITLYSCKNENIPIDPNPTDTTHHSSSQDSMRLLSKFYFFLETTNFKYDSLNHLVSIDNGYPSYFFYENSKIHHIVTNETSTQYINTLIFEYGSNGKCSKIYYNGIYSNENDSITVYDPFFGSIHSPGVLLLDSLVYSNTNQLTDVYHNINSDTALARAKLFYDSPNSESPYKLQWYEGGTLYQELNLTFDSIANPAEQFWWYQLGKIPLSITDDFPFLDGTNNSRLKMILPLLPKIIKSSQFVIPQEAPIYYKNTYNSDSTILTKTSSYSNYLQKTLFYFTKVHK